MNRHRARTRSGAWVAAHLLLVAAGCAWWGWLDWRYVNEFWAPGEMQAAAEWIPLGLAGAAMAFNLWALRHRRPAVHLFGSAGAALLIVALWWGIVALTGGWFHSAIGGTPAT